jgi:ACS family hexuronate transporter-like MFS transporter
MGTLVTTIGYTPFFVGLAALDLLGALILWTVVREPVAATLPAAGRAATA